ncbi:MAG: helix-turn-helix transcriptional regulator [Parasporobacterium sp.]|nr:helix-turn-helix transcriptional regulator [Parasporobacterium sp.]
MHTDMKKFPLPDRQKTGRKISFYIKSNKISVETLRVMLNLGSVQSIYHWLEGRALPSVDNLYALSIIFNVTIDHILCGNYDQASEDASRILFPRMQAYQKKLRKAARQ